MIDKYDKVAAKLIAAILQQLSIGDGANDPTFIETPFAILRESFLKSKKSNKNTNNNTKYAPAPTDIAGLEPEYLRARIVELEARIVELEAQLITKQKD